MNLTELYQDTFFTLPKKWDSKKNFESFVSKELRVFLSKIETLNDLEGLNYDLELVITRQKHLIKNIERSISDYLNGKPAKAFNKLRNGLQGSEKDFLGLLNIRAIEVGTDFFRLRYSEQNKPFERKEFFHIPFELRGKVKTQRFSIPGFPSLYLGTSIYVCWEELNRPNINHFQGVRLSNKDEFNIIDLSPPLDLKPKSIYDYLMVWPLIFTSSIRVKNINDDFKPEYIIPQLLLQYVREIPSIDGIKYRTTHIDFTESKAEGEFINLVLPVKTNDKHGLCKELESLFEITEANSYQLHNAATDRAPLYTSKEEGMQTVVESIELVKGRVFKYNISSLCELEGALQGMELLKIN